jgi:uncharacterized protein
MGPMSERFEMRVDEDILSRVDKWREKQADVPSRAEAMRRLVEVGLTRTASQAVRFSDGEKLLVMMMVDVYRHLKIKGEIDPDFISGVIYGGHYWAAKWEMGGLFTDYEDDARDVHFVTDVLDMWRLIESAYVKLSKKDKDRVLKEADPFGTHVEFRGFDGNNETSHMGIARFLVEKMGRWSQFKGRELNSHSPTLVRYGRMLAVFAPMRTGLVGTGLDANQLIRILKAQSYRE